MKHLALVIPISLFICSCTGSEEEIRPQLRNLTEAVYASGVVVPEDEYSVVSAAEGFLTRSLVKEGDSIRAGQSLFIVENDQYDAQLTGAGKLLEKTIPVTSGDNAPLVRELKMRLDASLSRLHNDSVQHARYSKLYQQDAISASSYDRQRLQFDIARKEVASLQQQLEQQRLNAALQLQQANNQVLLARTSQQNGVVKSRGDGVVYEIYRKTGDIVHPTQPIALVGRGNMVARLLVDEDDLERVRIGQQVIIKMDAFPGQTFTGTLQRIYPILNRVEQSFRVDVHFDEMPAAILYGLNVEANIVVKKDEPAIVIPRTALLKGDSVLVKRGKTVGKVKVETGITDEKWVQVVAGIDTTTIILMP